jgi:hypothetical protein
MVPAERIELPTFGLQNRCTTAVLRRLRLSLSCLERGRKAGPRCPISRRERKVRARTETKAPLGDCSGEPPTAVPNRTDNTVKTLRYSKAGAKLALAALLAGSAVIAAPLGGEAAAAKSKSTQSQTSPPAASVDAKKGEAATKAGAAADPEAIAAKRDPQYTSANGTATDEGCLRQRKRLWIEGEGWMVRKVTVCP